MTFSKRAALARSSLAAGALAALSACAALPAGTQPDARDPWERMNRATYRFNDTMDRAIAAPVARAYNKVLPSPVRRGISNVFDNAKYPGVIVSQLLQGKIKATGQDTGRLLVNTALGLGGLFDVASEMGLEEHDEDFGQVFGKWGMGPGPYLMLPILGPSTLRDTVGQIPDQFTNATHYIEDDVTRYSVSALRLLDDRASLLDGDKFLGRSADPYVLIRSAWLQRRAYLVSDGAESEEPVTEDFEDPEPEADQPPATDPAPQADPAPETHPAPPQ